MKKIVKIERNEKYGNVVSSRIIANELGKMHKTILRDIDNISILGKIVPDIGFTIVPVLIFTSFNPDTEFIFFISRITPFISLL